jgi:transcriptional regulator with XRE-family HTH domain
MDNVTVGKRLFTLRKHLTLNQSEFAKKLGLTQTAISALELDKTTLTEANYKLICFTFGVSNDWLRNGSGNMFDTNKIPDIQELLETVKQLTPASRKMILDLARSLFANEQSFRSNPQNHQ